MKYRIACAMPISGYSLFLDGHPIQSLETEVFGTDPTTKAVVATDAFSCNGTIPGYGDQLRRHLRRSLERARGAVHDRGQAL